MIGLTPKQRQLLDYIVDYRARFGSPPNYRKMRDAMGFKSNGPIIQLLGHLEERGYVRRTARKACSLELLHDDQCAHCGHVVGSAQCRDAAARNVTYSSTPAAEKVAA